MAELVRRLSLWDATSLVVGAVIGSAIFLVPSTLLQANPAPASAMIALIFAAGLSFLGALAYAELGAMLPDTGGEYVYLSRSWGPLVAFLCGWTHLLVVQSGGIAAIATGFSELASAMVPMSPLARKVAPILLMTVLTWINYLGVQVGARAGNWLSVSKVAGLGVMIVAVLAKSNPVPVAWSWPRDWTPTQFSAALVPCLWAFEGWNLLGFVGGEVRDPRRVLPRALAFGLGIVAIVYAASLWVFLTSLTVPEIQASRAVAADAAMRVLGKQGGTLVTVTMLIALTGSLNACILAAPRMYYAQARNGYHLPVLAWLHPRFHTPVAALLLQLVWSSILVVSGSYDLLFSYCTFGAWLFYGLVVAAVIVLRKSQPEAVRPFKMWGYPYTAILFVLVAFAFVVSCLIDKPGPSGIGLLLILTGLPVYWLFQRRRIPHRL